MSGKEIVKLWLIGNGHTEEQAKNFFNSDKYKYLIMLIDKALSAKIPHQVKKVGVAKKVLDREG